MNIDLKLGDCLKTMHEMEDNSVDSVVSDPPYGISFMGKKWDYDVPKVEVWEEAMRVLKPGGHILVACGTRTQHRMAVNIEDAGFEIRDIVAWVYGSGFPKSHNIGVAVDKLQGNEREDLPPHKFPDGSTQRKTARAGIYSKQKGQAVNTKGTSKHEGWGTALKPAMELWTLARKPLSEKTIAENVLKWGTGGINIDGSRVGIDENDKNNRKPSVPDGNSDDSRNCYGKGLTGRPIPNLNQQGRFPANLIHDGSDEVVGLFPDSKTQGHWSKTKTKGFGSFGNGSSTYKGVGEKDKAGGNASRFFYCAKASKSERNVGLDGFEEKEKPDNYIMPKLTCSECGSKRVDSSNKLVCGCNGKTHYEQQNSKDSPNNLAGGNKNHHPTVKPIKLMQYLTRLITPKDGTVLDPYMGSGTTGIACKKENFNFIGIELDKDYFKIAKARIEKAKNPHNLVEHNFWKK